MSRETISDLVKSRVPCPVGHPACHNARSIPPRIRNLHLHPNIAGQQLRTPGIDSPGVGGSPGHRPEGVSRACGPHRAPARQAHERRGSSATRPAGVSDARHCPQARFRHGTCGRSRYSSSDRASRDTRSLHEDRSARRAGGLPACRQPGPSLDRRKPLKFFGIQARRHAPWFLVRSAMSHRTLTHWFSSTARGSGNWREYRPLLVSC